MTGILLAAVLSHSLAALIPPVDPGDPYLGMSLSAGDSHQHAATISMLEREARDPPVPGFVKGLHEHGSSADAFDAMRGGGYDWGSVSHHDTNHPGQMANICIDPSSVKFRWWLKFMTPAGFADAAGPAGTIVNPPSNEALALSRVASAHTVEGVGGFLALAGREFTNYAFTPKGVGPREGGHKIVILPGETNGMCVMDGRLVGDEYCRSEYRLYRWLATSTVPQGVLIQAHPGDADAMDLRPLHPRNAPGGLSDAFVQGVEVSSSKNDPQWEASYQRLLRSGYRVFPAFGSDSHDATSAKQGANARKGATICWIEERTRHALLDAMLSRRCYYASSLRPALRYQMRPADEGRWVAMGGLVDAPDGRVAINVLALNDPRNASGDPRLARRFDVIELLDARGQVLASEPCTRDADGRDLCRLERIELHVDDGAIYPRVRMDDPNPKACRSTRTPDLLPNCGKLVIGSAIYVNWDRYLETTPYRVCRFGPDELPCDRPGCLPQRVDRDQDGFPDGCDVCPDLANPNQADADKDGFGDACPRR
jgi:hypothetical protein